MPGKKRLLPRGTPGFLRLFCRSPGVVNQQRDAGDDRDIGEIEDIPRESTDVKMIEIGDKPIG